MIDCLIGDLGQRALDLMQSSRLQDRSGTLAQLACDANTIVNAQRGIEVSKPEPLIIFHRWQVAANKGQLQVDKNCRDIGKLAVWSVTSAKPGNGVELLCDDRDDTYWQSDGSQPHLINIQFQKKVRLQSLAVYLDYKLDESYTPNKVSVSAGTSYDDLKHIKTIDMEEPSGWVTIPLQIVGMSEPLKAYFVQLAVISNHQNGRDTHIRQVKVFGPRQDKVQRLLAQDVGFSTSEMLMYSVVR